MFSSSGNVENDLTLAVRGFHGGVRLIRFLEMKAPRKLRPQPPFDYPVEDLGQALSRRLDGRPLHPYPRRDGVRRHRGGRKRDQHAARLERLQGAQVGLAAQRIENYVVWAGV